MLRPEAAAPARPTGSSRLRWLLLGVAAVWCCAWFLHARGYWEDDAWIHLEFARSLARGRGFELNGQVVYGDTSPLWVWLLAGMHAVLPDWMAAGKTLTVLGAVFALTGVYAFADSLVRSNGQPLNRNQGAVFGAAAVLLVVTNPYFGYWAFSGMEALAAMGLLCWAGVAAGPLRLTPRRFLLAALCAGLAPLLRPEMAFFTVLLGLVLLHRWVLMRGSLRDRFLLLVGGFTLALGPGMAWLVYAQRAFGTLLPTTNAAKRAGPADSVISRLLHVYALGFPLVLAGLLLLGGWFLWQLRAERRGSVAPVRAIEASRQLNGFSGLLHAGGWLLFFLTALNCLFYVVNHTFVQTRYIFVTAPVLTVALLAIAVKLSPKLAWAGIVLGCVAGVTISLLATWPLVGNKVQLDRDYADLAAFLRALPPNAPVAHYSIGEAAFLSEHPLVDTGGITRPGVIPFLWDSDNRRLVPWVHHEGARYWVIDHAPEPGATLIWRREIPTTGWYMDPRRYRERDLLEVWRLPMAPTVR